MGAAWAHLEWQISQGRPGVTRCPAAQRQELRRLSKKNGGPDHAFLEQIFEELRDWEAQLKHADIDWDELDDPGSDEPDLGL